MIHPDFVFGGDWASRGHVRAALVTPKPTDALKQHVGGREVGQEEVGVDVHTLLDHLGGNEHAAVRPATWILAEAIEPKPLQPITAELREARVQQGCFRRVAAAVGAQALQRGLGFGDGVANPKDTLAALGPAQTLSRSLGLGKLHASNSDPP